MRAAAGDAALAAAAPGAAAVSAPLSALAAAAAGAAAAGDAAWAKLEPTVTELQKSAYDLVLRMIAVTP